jgi:chaperonin cofactor prefoldin
MVELGKYRELIDKLDKDRTEISYPTNIEMIIELNKKIEDLEARINTLEKK